MRESTKALRELVLAVKASKRELHFQKASGKKDVIHVIDAEALCDAITELADELEEN